MNRTSPASSAWHRAAQGLERTEHYTADDFGAWPTFTVFFGLLLAGAILVSVLRGSPVWAIVAATVALVAAAGTYKICESRSVKRSTLHIERDLDWIAERIGDWRVTVLLAAPNTTREHMFGIATWKRIRDHFDSDIVDAVMALAADIGYFEVAEYIAGALWPYNDGRRKMDDSVGDILMEVLARLTDDVGITGRLFRESVQRELSIC